jgi:hypothetical protein
MRTATATIANAKSVPELAYSANFPTGRSAAPTEAAAPVTNVTTCGVRYRGWTAASLCGSSPSRAIVKKIRDWPNNIINRTDGRATTAASPMNLLIVGQPTASKTWTSASFEHTIGSSAPA